MKSILVAAFSSLFLGLVDGVAVQAHSAVKGTGSTTRGWSCCKNSCSWAGKAPVNSPVITCDNTDNLFNNPARRDGCDNGGGSYACSDLSPWAVSNDLSYGYAGVNLAAANETAWCCSCYKLTFTSGPVTGKSMVVQVTNTGNDLGNDQFDLAIPGGGQGATQGCSKQFGGPNVWGATYGGISHREECDAFPEPLKGGCYWRFDWFRNADNPEVTWEKVSCPEQLSFVSGCRRNDDPVPGKVTPTPSTTKSAPIASGTVAQGGQCGGRRYTGPTVCVGGTVCTFVSEDTYYCLPDPASTRTTPTVTSQTPVPTIAGPWDQCGGQGWTGPTRCKDSSCVYYDVWWSQCIPASNYVPSVTPPKVSTPVRVSTPVPVQPTPVVPGWPIWSFSRTRIVAPTPVTPTPVKPPTPSSTIVQLWEQCGGKYWEGPRQCASGLKCTTVDEFYSQCQKPSR
ncbi:carbohydrate-binding module family 1 protein [Amniculicola lignicola CBS 123094]|uniref:cellulase n=1 Tax=Amniculicola lignicola CBS 123094 TaxID=1392246 RepID=A0A6A5WWQ3_9PLEO|nr:carbohydrate-binding module family 1 protein [Amniculicola lignicola CBS 123094]